MSNYVSEGVEVKGSASDDESDHETASQHRAQGNQGGDSDEDGGENM